MLCFCTKLDATPYTQPHANWSKKKSGCTHSFLSTEDYLHSFPDTFSPKQITSRQSNPSWHNAECSVNNTERKWPSNPRTTSVLIGGKHHSTNESDLSTIYTPALLHNLDIKHLVNNVSNTSSRFHLWQSRLNTECVSHGQTADVVSARQFRGSSRRDVIRCSPTVCTASVNQLMTEQKLHFLIVQWNYFYIISQLWIPAPPSLVSITCWMFRLLHKISPAYSVWK